MYQRNHSIRKEIILSKISVEVEYSRLIAFLASVLIIVFRRCVFLLWRWPAPPRKRQFKVTAKVPSSALQNCPRLRIAKDFVFCLDSINEMRNYKLFWLKLTMLRRTFSWSGNYQVECWAITVKQTIYRQVPIASFSECEIVQ